jgi:hypothetical protein
MEEEEEEPIFTRPDEDLGKEWKSNYLRSYPAKKKALLVDDSGSQMYRAGRDRSPK